MNFELDTKEHKLIREMISEIYSFRQDVLRIRVYAISSLAPEDY